MIFRVKLFGLLRQTVGAAEVAVELSEPADCGQLRSAVGRLEPSLAPLLPACRFAVNHSYVDDQHSVQAADEIALIGLVSGG